jgi:hypothetical protein
MANERQHNSQRQPRLLCVEIHFINFNAGKTKCESSVPDPDLYVFGPPGTGSGNLIYLYGSGSFH